MADPIFTRPDTNAFDLADVGSNASPTFADIDGDGDLDAFVGNNYGDMLFYRNAGTAGKPVFNKPSSNPFDLTNIGSYASPTFADIDGDGDLDAFVGNYDGDILYYLNIGTASNPDFDDPLTNPFDLNNVGTYASPTFADIDGDGDLDAFVGNYFGDTLFYRNTGTTSSPDFAGFLTNPFGLTNIGSYANPTFADIDGDGDLDAFVGNNDGNTLFYRNTGTVSNPVFAAPRTNPFGLTNIGSYNSPSFADIDGDGDLDAFVGNGSGKTLFYLNNNPPTATNLKQTIAYTEDAISAIANIVIADHDVSNTFTATVTLAGGNSAIGSLSASSGNGETYSSATGVWTVKGTLTSVNAALAALSFKPVANGFANTSASVSISDGIAPAISGKLTFNGKAVNDAPVLKTPNVINYIDTAMDDNFQMMVDTLIATDADRNLLTFGITGGTDNDNGTISQRSQYGVLTISKATGAYAFVANDAAIEALTATASSSFTVTTSDGSLTTSKTLTINIAQSGTTESNGNDALTGTSVNDRIVGFAGNDIIDGLGGADNMKGGLGNDIYFVDNVGDVVTETSTLTTEIDTVNSSISYTLTANVENLTLIGTAAINGTGNALNNLMIGNTGSNTLNGGLGGDVLFGSLGNDIYFIDNIDDVVIEISTLESETDAVNSSISYSLTANVENLALTGFAAINGRGNALNNVLLGNTGANTLNGGTGADTLTGGLGNDVYVIDNAGDFVTETSTLTTEIDSVNSSISYTLGANLENLNLTGTAPTKGTGNTLNNALTGNTGANTLNGGAGADTMAGNFGNDVYYVDNAGDVVIETSSLTTEIDRVNSSISYTLTSNVENLTLTGTAAINGTGNTLNNVLIGNTGTNILNGGLGADTMKGGLGNDVYYVNNTGDIVIETSTLVTESDKVYSSISYTITDNVENLTLTGTAANNGTGNSLNNILIGNSGANNLNGGTGADTLNGGAGNDVLTGDAGKDIFQLTNLSKDSITDFSVVDDTIQLKNSVFTQLTATGVLNADYFKIGAAATDANDYVIYNSGTGVLSYDADGNGAGAATEIGVLGIKLALTNADFVVF